jgi:hypothetical protein
MVENNRLVLIDELPKDNNIGIPWEIIIVKKVR